MIGFKIGKLKRAYGADKTFNDVYLDSIGNIETSFAFKVDDKIILQEENWNIVEFIHQLASWKNRGLINSFHYNCMDSDEDSIFVFHPINEEFRFLSTWANVELERSLKQSEITEFIDNIKDSIVKKVLNEFQVDLRKIPQLCLQ